jgi:RNA polymerase sigma-70 factor (ECF subfamily)
MLRTEDEYVCEILRTEKALRAFLHRVAPQPADLEDLLQETYSHLFRLSDEQRRAVRNVQGFAMTSAHNVAMDWVRRKRVIPIDSADDLSALSVIDESSDLEAIVSSHQQLMRLAEGVARLPRRCREVFTLRHVYGYSQKEIAQRLAISEGAVEQLLIRGMRRCMDWMGATMRGGQKRSAGLLTRWQRLLMNEEDQG